MTSVTVYDKFLNSADRERHVAEVIVTASGTVSTVSGEPNVFHWRFYFPLRVTTPQSATSTQAIVFDMSPTNPPTGCLVISSNNHSTSTARVKIELPIAVVGTPTVQQFIDLFLQKGMDRYKFDETGSGCVHWVMTSLYHLEEAAFVEAGASEKLRSFHAEHVAAHPERHPMPIRKGQFYW